jgi:7-carboxy-7-deazaguanine synthase
LAGCNLNCSWCDTRYAAEGPGQEVEIDQIVDKISRWECNLVCITGGEPLLQANTIHLTSALIDLDYMVLVETNGSQDISTLPEGVIRVMDVKCPGSGECGSTDLQNLRRLHPDDEVKFVIADRQDFDWTAKFIKEHSLEGICTLLLSPVLSGVEDQSSPLPLKLAEWLLESGLDARLQIQIHKLYPFDHIESRHASSPERPQSQYRSDH